MMPFKMKPESTYKYNMKIRNILLSAIAALTMGCSSHRNEQLLPSWNDTPVKQKLVEFITHQADKIPVDHRIAVVDMDGTLICERPFGIETMVSIHRLLQQGETDEAVRQTVEYDYARRLAVNPRDTSVLNHCWDNGQNYLQNIILKPFHGADFEEYIDFARNCLNREKNADYHKTYADMVYQPMIELVEALKEKEFEIYVVSGSMEGIVWSICPQMIGAERDHLLGIRHPKRVERTSDGKLKLVLEGEMLKPVNDYDGKIVNIYDHIGKMPTVAIGNSYSDFGMFHMVEASPHPHLALLLHHDDAEREYEYSPCWDSRVNWQDTLRAYQWLQADMSKEFKVVWKNTDHKTAIVPQPVEMNLQSGTYLFPRNTSIAAPNELRNEAQLLKQYLEKDYGQSVRHGKRHQSDVVLELDTTLFAGQKEAYALDINQEKVVIRGSDAAGVFYGIQTLRQLISQKNNRLVAQQVKVKDYPRFEWRAFMLDEARNFKGKEAVKHLLDEMAALKMNVFHWHLTNDQGWRMEIKKYPRLTKIGAYRDSTEIDHFESNRFDGKPHKGYYTQNELREVVAYAQARHINIVPEITVPGHVTAACAAYPWLGTSGEEVKVSPKFGVHYHALNVADERVYEFLSDVFDEVIGIFPFDVIHIGGDELRYNQWNESPEIQAYMKEHNLKGGAELQVHFTNRLSKMLQEKGRRMIGWNEITGDKLHEYQAEEDEAQQESQLAEGTMVQFWKGDPALMKRAIEQGFDIVNSYHIFTYLDYDYNSINLQKAYSFDPIPEGVDSVQAQQVKGIGCQMWGEFIPTEEDMDAKVFPRIAAYAEVGWTPANKMNYDRFVDGLQYFLRRWAREGIETGPVR